MSGIYTANRGPVVGTVLGSTPYVLIRWPWLLFLTLELAMSGIFLTGTILASRSAKVQIIKSSSLAAFCAVDDFTRSQLGNIADMEGMKSKVMKTDVRLEGVPTGPGLWLTMRKFSTG
jgi:hypothetical protein